MKIEHVMSTNVVVADIETSVYDIARMMKENDVGLLPISKGKKIVGVITDRDIVTRILANKDEKLEGYLSTDLVTIDFDNTVEDALEKMRKKKIKRLLVKHDQHLVGIVSLSDLIQYDNEMFMESLKQIWEINRNIDVYKTGIDQFEL